MRCNVGGATESTRGRIRLSTGKCDVKPRRISDDVGLLTLVRRRGNAARRATTTTTNISTSPILARIV